MGQGKMEDGEHSDPGLAKKQYFIKGKVLNFNCNLTQFSIIIFDMTVPAAGCDETMDTGTPEDNRM